MPIRLAAMRWVLASVVALVVLLLTFPILASGSSDGPGKCTSPLGLQTLGDSESCDTWGVAVVLPGAAVAFGLVAWGLRRRHVEPE